MRASADFFIRRERDPDRSVLDVRMFDQVRHCRHDFGNARFVVGSEQRRAVCCNQRLAFIAGKLRELLRRQDDIEFVIQNDIMTVVAFNNLRIHIFSGKIGRGVHVSQKTDSRHVFIRIRLAESP